MRMIFSENRCLSPIWVEGMLFGIMRYTFFRTVSPKMPDGMNNSTTSTTT
jgi:hypothetical protein